MPFAANDKISKAPIEGGVEISEQEYNQAREHLLSGKLVKVEADQMFLTEKPEKRPEHEEPKWQDGEWLHTPIEQEPKTIEELAEEKRRDIEKARDAAIDDGFTHAFGDTDDVVQTRQRDRENLTGLAVSAQRHPDKTFQFRAKSNATYELTADDMLALADAAQTHVSDQYGKSWQLKAEIDAALEAEDRDALDAITW